MKNGEFTEKVREASNAHFATRNMLNAEVIVRDGAGREFVVHSVKVRGGKKPATIIEVHTGGIFGEMK